MKKRNIVLIITSCIILSVISIVAGARKNIYAMEGKSIPSMSGAVKVLANEEINSSEAEVLFILSKELEGSVSKSNANNYIHPDYIACLQKFLSTSRVNLSASEVHKIKELINELRFIIHLENENEFTKMTIDGREMAAQLLKEIYGICGVEIEYSMDGKIEKVIDGAGSILYQNESSLPQGEFRIDTFMIVIFTILTLLGVGIVLTKKSQILAREVIFDGFDEQKYA